MDADGQQGTTNDQVGHAQTDKINHANEDDSSPSSLNNYCSLENTEFDLSPIQFEDKENVSEELYVSMAWKTEQLKDKSKNEAAQEATEEEEEEEDFEALSEISFLKDTSLTSSPSRNFKSSYAKSLADSYRRASLPVIVSAPKGQFYFKNEEFLSLNSSQMRQSGFNHDKFLSFNSSTSKTILPQGSEPISLPTILDIAREPQEQQSEIVRSSLNDAPADIYHQLLVDGEIFIPIERLHSACEENGGSFSLRDWHNFGSIITSDGRKLVKLSDLKTKWSKQKLAALPLNGHSTKNGPDKDTQVESLRLEREQSEGRIEQLCEVLADRDATIQRLEEDLLRIRMECQRLIVDNRSLKSNLSHSGPQSVGGDTATEVSKLQQQVQLLTAQLSKAERSRHTYEAATRQLVDFLHTVNSTLNMTSNHSTRASPASPTTSLYSAASPAITIPSATTAAGSSKFIQDDGDPPYRLANSKTPSPDLIPSSSSHSFGPVRRNSDAVRKAGSVWALPTQSGNPRRVSRALSTYCVASTASGTSHSNAVSSASHDRGRALTSEFLATRAKELIASLKSLMRSDSVLKLNLEPKKSDSSVNRDGSTSRSMKSEGGCVASVSDTDHNTKTVSYHAAAAADPQTSCQEKAYPDVDSSPIDRDQNILSSKSDASPEVSQNLISTNATTVAPRITNSTAREDILQTQSSMRMNGNPQPLSLMVVGESSSTHDDQHFSSLPNRSRVSGTLNDSDHRLVWV
ncbi:hypothetical protein OTU49_016246 [Cherax quadricarinatus]|uniref:Uncharacterized protein n=1 Tax=Cherax quadricarinatus TaxID=27406 RepID=A0AAW0XVU6_CHEQU